VEENGNDATVVEGAAADIVISNNSIVDDDTPSPAAPDEPVTAEGTAPEADILIR